MAKNKYDFIKEILESKKLTLEQKERILLLTKKEIESNRSTENSLQERIEKLEGILKGNGNQKSIKRTKEYPFELLDIFVSNENHFRAVNEELADYGDKRHFDSIKEIEDLKSRVSVLEGKKPPKDLTSEIYHSPKKMVSYLYSFSKDEKFKWFTHDAEGLSERINYKKNIEFFEKATRQNFGSNLNLSTVSFVKEFISGKNLKIEFPKFQSHLTYKNEELLQKLNDGENPFKIVIDGTHFVDIIKRFKNAIEFRLDAGDDYKFNFLIKNFITNRISVDILEKYTKSFNDLGNSLTTYIDINNFFKGLSIIIEWINDYKGASTDVEIDMEEKEGYYKMMIFHKGSYFSHEPDSEKIKGLSGDFSKLRKFWFSIVDLEIQADLGKKHNLNPYSIICLDKNSQMQIRKDNPATLNGNKIEKLNLPVGGVKYLINIYKNKS